MSNYLSQGFSWFVKKQKLQAQPQSENENQPYFFGSIDGTPRTADVNQARVRIRQQEGWAADKPRLPMMMLVVLLHTKDIIYANP